MLLHQQWQHWARHDTTISKDNGSIPPLLIVADESCQISGCLSATLLLEISLSPSRCYLLPLSHFPPIYDTEIATIHSNKQGQTRLSSYYDWISLVERNALESEIIRKCLSRSEFQCSFVEYRGYKVVYRRYASLFFIVGTKLSKDGNDNPENELGLLEFIHNLVETMDKW